MNLHESTNLAVNSNNDLRLELAQLFAQDHFIVSRELDDFTRESLQKPSLQPIMFRQNVVDVAYSN